jgi:hypothetical protein
MFLLTVCGTSADYIYQPGPNEGEMVSLTGGYLVWTESDGVPIPQIAWYPFSNNVYSITDSSGENNYGHAFGTQSYNTNHAANSSVGSWEFNGSSGKIISDHVFPVFGTNARTFMCWLKSDKADYTSDGSMLNSGAGVNQEWLNYIPASSDELSFYEGQTERSSGISVNTNVWQHFAVSYGLDEYINIYVDGIRHVRTQDTDISTDSDFLDIGNRFGSSFFDGLIDDIYVYYSEVSSNSIFDIYDSGAYPTNGTMLEYKFLTDFEFTNVVDETANGFDGDIQEGTVSESTWNTNGYREFDGVNDFIDFSYAYPLSNTVSISVWVNSTDLADFLYYPVAFSEGASSRLFLRVGGKYAVAPFAADSIGVGVNGIVKLASTLANSFPNTNTGTWFNVVATIDTGASPTTHIYINGIDQVLSTNLIDEAVGTINNGKIGRRADSAVGYWAGDIDDVRISTNVFSSNFVFTTIFSGGRQ